MAMGRSDLMLLPAQRRPQSSVKGAALGFHSVVQVGGAGRSYSWWMSAWTAALCQPPSQWNLWNTPFIVVYLLVLIFHHQWTRQISIKKKNPKQNKIKLRVLRVIVGSKGASSTHFFTKAQLKCKQENWCRKAPMYMTILDLVWSVTFEHNMVAVCLICSSCII